VKAEKGQDRKVPGEANPGWPDHTRDVAERMINLERGCAARTLASASHSRRFDRQPTYVRA